jgi:hypothetical protein
LLLPNNLQLRADSAPNNLEPGENKKGNSEVFDDGAIVRRCLGRNVAIAAAIVIVVVVAAVALAIMLLLLPSSSSFESSASADHHDSEQVVVLYYSSRQEYCVHNPEAGQCRGTKSAGSSSRLKLHTLE